MYLIRATGFYNIYTSISSAIFYTWWLFGPLRKKDLLINAYAAVDYFGQYKMMQKTWKMNETLAHWYLSENIQQELSNRYQNDRV